MTTLYELLGADPAASQDQLKAAYRRRARQLHPDLNRNQEAGGEMRRLNQAWAILSDPDARRHYDEELAAQRPASPPPAPADPRTPARDYTFDADILPGRIPWWAQVFRPSVLLLVVLFLIFIGTAYATHPGSGGSSPPQPSSTTTTSPSVGSTAPTTAPGPNLVGRCIVNQATSVLVVPCSETPNSLVLAVVPAQVSCPAGTMGLLLEGQPEQVCAQASNP